LLKTLEIEKEELKETIKQTDRQLTSAKLEASGTKADRINYDVAFLQQHVAQVV
jgi:hypothetical protein